MAKSTLFATALLLMLCGSPALARDDGGFGVPYPQLPPRHSVITPPNSLPVVTYQRPKVLRTLNPPPVTKIPQRLMTAKRLLTPPRLQHPAQKTAQKTAQKPAQQ